jgi:lysophospholipase L1-like esterase
MPRGHLLFVAVGLILGYVLHHFLVAHNVTIGALILKARYPAIASEPTKPITVTDLVAPVYAGIQRHAALVMLGDSLTAVADWNALLPGVDVANRGIFGERSDDILKRSGAIAAMRPRCIALMMGANDGLENADRISANARSIILAVSPAHVILQSTLPVRGQSPDKVNAGLKAVCTGNCEFLDLVPSIAPAGQIPDGPDGIHLGPESYKRWRDELRPVVERALCVR